MCFKICDLWKFLYVLALGNVEERPPCAGKDIEGADGVVAQGLEGAPLAAGVDERVVVHGCKKKIFKSCFRHEPQI